MRCPGVVLAALLFIGLGLAPAEAEKRVALVIGNGDYQHADRLANPVTDARALRDALDKLGFEIVYGENLGKQQLERTIGGFARTAQDADVALVFFAGHGATFGDTPYVVPVDAQFSSLEEMPYELVTVETLIGELRRVKRLRIAILDACRDNAAEKSLKTVAARGGEITRGLARVKSPEGLILAYATQHLSTAADGPPNGDSPFTAALLHHITTPGLDVKDLFFRVGSEVIASTMGRQRPEVSVSFYDSYALVPAGPSAAPSPTQDQAAQAWAGVKDTSSMAMIEAFIVRYGDSIYGDFARARRDELKKSQVAVVAPPVQPATPPTPVQPAIIAPPAQCGGSAALRASLSARAARPLSSAEECVLRSKDVFKECDKCPEMVVVPSGTFTMGSPTSEAGRMVNEGPQLSAAIAKPLAVGKFTVTFEEWDACVADRGCGGYKPSDAGWGRNRRPVINVSWDDAKAYVAWLSRKTGQEYRLLSESEREYAARAGSATPFWWGSSISTSQDDGTSTYGNGAKGEYRKKTVPVDSFQPNPFGLYQVHGNVWEWTEDCYHDSYDGAPSDGSAWTAGDCSRRVVRGGSWGFVPGFLRAAFRFWLSTDGRYDYLGFRVGRTLLTP
jgi:formylglycine-generating enzyme required for sulfatase activity/uncharacterized caspase-like protein